MKKKGATLVTVLVIFTALIIIATAISSAVINTNKLNKRYSDTIDLELAAKSGINIVKDDFISKVKNKEIKTLENVNEYIGKVNSSSWIGSEGIKNFFKEYSDNNIELDVALSLDSKDDKNVLKITSKAENKGILSVEKIEEQSLVLNINEGGSGEGDTGGNNVDSEQTKPNGDLSGILDENVALIIDKRNSIISIDHVNNGILVVDEKKWYNNFNNSNGLHNNEKTIEKNINIDIPQFGIENSTNQNNKFYLTTEGINYNFDSQKQDYYEITVDGKYKVNNNYNNFIVIRVDGNLTIAGRGNAQNINRNIIYVVNGNVSLDSQNDNLSMQQTAIMAMSVKNIGSKTIGFNSGLIITKELYLPKGQLNPLNGGSRVAISIIDKVIKGEIID